jgi:tetratricopeptide (TPR) repeat protein
MHVVVLLCVLSAAPQVLPQDPSRTGWEALQAGDGEKAASAFRMLLASNPNDARALVGAGIASHLNGRDDQALSYLKRAVQAAPDSIDALYYLGNAAYAQGDLDLAIKSYEHVLKLSPGERTVAKQLEDWKKEAALHGSYTAQPTARFNVMFEGATQQEIATRVSAVLEAAYARIGQRLSYPPETVTAILYTGEQFRDITKSPSWAAAAYDGRIRIPVRGALNVPSELERIVTHEYVHAVIHQLYPRVPEWLNEGLATYLEPGDHAWLTARLRGAEEKIPMARLSEAFQTGDATDAAIAYAESYVGARILAERLGQNLPVFLQYVSNGTTVDQALELFGISAADVEQQWTKAISPSTPARRPKH